MRPLLPSLCLVACACATTAPTPAPAPAEAPAPAAAPVKLQPPRLRLPDGVKPAAYQLELKVVPGEERFEGTVTVELELARPSEVVWLNGTHLEPGAAELTQLGQKIGARAEVADSNFIAVVPAHPLAAGTASLTLHYTGVLSKKDGGGLFQLKEGDDWYAYTHFEPLDARRAFPCFDEPSFKVSWQVTLHLKQEQQAFSNTPPASEHDDGNGMKTVVFGRTRPLPSYLVAFAVGPYEAADAGRWGRNKLPVRIIVPKGKVPEAKWAVESTGPILEQLEKYFGSVYPYEKLDLIALPTFAGAMENPGLVTFGHQIILSKPEEDSVSRQRSYASVCAHELAHMWSGDLVTMAWWDDLWLNEAFATWMSSKVLEAWQPKWEAPINRVSSRNNALGNDSLVSARKIRQPIATDDDISNAFDGITYGKGAAVLDMFEHWVGVEAFQRGVQRYLSEHAYGNATADDFLGAITKEAGKDVATPFSTFLDQPGAPRVAMELQCPKEGPKLLLSQRRQLPIGSKGEANEQWQVPVCVRWSAKGKEGEACTLLTSAKGELPLTGAKGCPDWLLPNANARGYYRANLSGALDLVTSLERAGKKLTVAERVGAFSDLRALVGSGDVDLAVALDAIPLMLSEDNLHLVNAALGTASFLADDVVPDDKRAKYEAMVEKTFGARARKLSLKVGAKDDEDTRLMRPGLLIEAGREGRDPQLRKEAVKLAHAWVKDKKAIHPDVVDYVLGIAADTDDASLHQELLEVAKTEKDRAERNHAIGGLCNFRAPALVQQNFDFLLGGPLDIRETFRLVWCASNDHRTRDLAFQFVRDHWDLLMDRLPKDSGASLVYVAAGYCDEKHRDEARSFFDGRSTKYLGGPRNFSVAMEEIDLCIAFRARQQPNALAWLDRFKAK